MPTFITYQTYPSPEVAQSLLALLDEHGIAYQTDYAPAHFNAALSVTSNGSFVVRLPAADFTRARQLEETQATASLAELPADYYLLNFSNAELWELLAQPDAWNSHDVALAKRLLHERGETVTDSLLQGLRADRTASLAAPSTTPTSWIVAGYALALLGGLFGMGIGWSLRHYRKTLPDGRQVPGYSPGVRTHGLYILLLGAVSLVAWVIRVW